MGREGAMAVANFEPWHWSISQLGPPWATVVTGVASDPQKPPPMSREALAFREQARRRMQVAFRRRRKT